MTTISTVESFEQRAAEANARAKAAPHGSRLNRTASTEARIWSEAAGILRQTTIAGQEDAALFRKLAANHWNDGPETLVVTRSKSLQLGVDTYSDDRLREALADVPPAA